LLSDYDQSLRYFSTSRDQYEGVTLPQDLFRGELALREVAKLSQRRQIQDLFSQESLSSNLVLNILVRALKNDGQVIERPVTRTWFFACKEWGSYGQKR